MVEADLDQRLAVDKPPIRRREDGHGYDEILSKFNNPLELAEVVKAQGLHRSLLPLVQLPPDLSDGGRRN